MLGSVCDPILVVAAAEQVLPTFASPEPNLTIETVRDGIPDAGPLGGIAAGYRAISGRSALAFVAACDLPFLRPQVVTRLSELVGDCDAAVPLLGGKRHPLAAIYRVAALAKAEELLSRGEHRATALLDELRTRYVTPAELAEADPELQSLQNVNTPQDYAALTRDG